MTDDELQARFKELEEHMEACAALAALPPTELLGIFSAILIQKGVCTPETISQFLDLALADTKPLKGDSPEMAFGKKVLGQAIGLLQLRLAQAEIHGEGATLQ